MSAIEHLGDVAIVASTGAGAVNLCFCLKHPGKAAFDALVQHGNYGANDFTVTQPFQACFALLRFAARYT